MYTLHTYSSPSSTRVCIQMSCVAIAYCCASAVSAHESISFHTTSVLCVLCMHTNRSTKSRSTSYIKCCCCCLIGHRHPASFANSRLFHPDFPGGCIWARVTGFPRRLPTKKLTKSLSHQQRQCAQCIVLGVPDARPLPVVQIPRVRVPATQDVPL